MMAKAELNQDMIATMAGEITVFNYDGETREYLSSYVEYLAVGVGIPANSCVDVRERVKPALPFAVQKTFHHGNISLTTVVKRYTAQRRCNKLK